MGIKETAATFHTSRNTVRKYVRLFLSSGKSIAQLLSLSAEQLHEMFGGTESRPREPSSQRIELEALLPGYVSRLTRKGMSVRKLFKEYHAEYPDGLQQSSFKRAVRQYKFHIKVVGHVEHYAADQRLQYGYQALREVLELGEDADFLPDEDGRIQPEMTSPIPLTHKNIRGRDYYRKDKQEQ